MPCSDSRDWGGGESCSRKHCGGTCERIKEALDQATRAGCDMRTLLRRVGLEPSLTAETREWIAMHDQQDAERIRKWLASASFIPAAQAAEVLAPRQ